jgi:hypothetical protein
MTQKVVTFFGRGEGIAGLPNPFHRYLLVEDSVPKLGKGIRIVSVVAFTDNSPLPAELEHFLVRNLTSAKAMKLAVDRLRGLAQMKGLEMH